MYKAVQKILIGMIVVLMVQIGAPIKAANIIEDGNDNDTYVDTNTGGDPDEIEFHTNGSERMIIESGGDVGIGATNPGAQLEVLDTSEPLRLSYDASNYTSFSVQDDGDLWLGKVTAKSTVY